MIVHELLLHTYPTVLALEFHKRARLNVLQVLDSLEDFLAPLALDGNLEAVSLVVFFLFLLTHLKLAPIA